MEAMPLMKKELKDDEMLVMVRREFVLADALKEAGRMYFSPLKKIEVRLIAIL